MFSREALGNRYDEINDKRKNKISQNANIEACRRAQKLGVESRLRNSYKILDTSNMGRQKGCIPWNKGLSKSEHPSIMKAALNRIIHPDKVRYSDGWNKDIKNQAYEEHGNFCNTCDSEENLLIHHKDLSKDNHELGNLIPMCRSCHTRLHGRLQNNLALASRMI